MTATHQKNSESKYVTCFADSRPDVDITFRDVLLGRPTDHYLVGVDNFSMTNTSLSMLEPMTGDSEVFIRCTRRLKPLQNTDAALNLDELNMHFGLGGAVDLSAYQDNFDPYRLSVSSQESILSMQQLLERLNQMGADVTRYMNDGRISFDAGAAAADQTRAAALESDGYKPDGYTGKHLQFSMTLDGGLRISGSRAFWANFVLEVPATQNQFALYGTDRSGTDFTRQRRFLSLDPLTGERSFAKIQVTVQRTGEDTDAFTVHGSTPKAYSVASFTGHTAPQKLLYNTGETDFLTFNTRGSIFSALERRIALEIGCSLPIKNSPMVDHQRESPDFVLGRWIWRTDPRIGSLLTASATEITSNMPACTEYQGPRDRITYHELRPQSKIQTLRIKLFARIRTFNESTERYGMRIVELPTNPTDWWHARLHFMSKE